jgi:anti-anti-sigma factor
MGQLENGGSHAKLETSSDGSGAPIISITGEIDMANVESIEAELDSLIAPGCELLVFDLSALEFIDSSGIALLLRAADKTERIELRNPSATVVRIIRATGLSDVLHVAP